MESRSSIPFIDFLGSNTVELRTSSSSGSWKIHQGLLKSKCNAVESAFSHDFQENYSGQYTFLETTHDTVARFIEWSYRGDYTEADLTTVELPEPEQAQSENLDAVSPRDEKKAKALQAHTLLCHLRIYIFSDTYVVTDLKNLAFEKFTSVVVNMGQPKNRNEQLAVIDCLSVAFSKLPQHDKLLGWLAQNAAWCISNLRLQSKFHKLVQSSPALVCRMMETLNPASEAPWNTKEPKYRVPSYNASASYDEDDDAYSD